MTISGKAKIAGVIGWPVSHSRSPLIHNSWLESLGIDGAYIPLNVAPDDFESALRALPKLGFAGVNVTIPHKERAFALLDEVDDAAKATGAVNTVTFTETGLAIGTNSDGVGFVAHLKETHGAIPTGTVVILGAGGAARGIIAALASQGCSRIVLVNRTTDKAEKLKSDFSDMIEIEVRPLSNINEAADKAELLINTSSVGMNNEGTFDIDFARLSSSAIVADIVYSPLETRLLAEAHEAGLTTLDGLGMLLHQATTGFQIWFGQKPEVTEEVRQIAANDLTKGT